VVVPDRQLIMENMLMAEGFVEAKMLAKKFASLYYLLEDLLSPAKYASIIALSYIRLCCA
jgi:dynein heavy chain